MIRRSYHASPFRLPASSAPDASPATSVLQDLETLRAELADLAFSLERRGRTESADVAIAAAARINEVILSLGGGRASPAF